MRQHLTMRVLLLAAATSSVAAAATLTSQDTPWLDRVTCGPTTATVDQYLKLGRRRFLEQQLHPLQEQLDWFWMNHRSV